MRVVVTGSSGFIGTALTSALEQRGDRVVRLTRDKSGGATWDPDAGTISTLAFEGADAVVNLAGAGIGEKKWTPEYKRTLVDSRIKGTTLLARTLADLPNKPRVLVSGSAVGYYGDGGDTVLDEESPSGDDFLSGLCRDWEAATQPAADAGVRVVHIRTGIVLDPKGGAVKRLLTPFRLGVGGRVASGKQWMSWITLADEVGAILHALDTDALQGPINLTAPNPVTNEQLTKALGHVLHRPTVLPTPRLPLELVLGKELVHALLVIGQRALPRKLEQTNYAFAQADLESALRALLAPMPAE